MSATEHSKPVSPLKVTMARLRGVDVTRPGWGAESERRSVEYWEARRQEFVADPDGEPLRVIEGGAS